MRLRNFTAGTMQDAMALVRDALGSEAVIVSTQDGDDGMVSVTAALDEPEPKLGLEHRATDITDLLSEALAGNGVPGPLTEKILMASLSFDAADALAALSGALGAVFAFAPVPEHGRRRPIILVGPPGAGKTVTAAKLAARAVIAGASIRVATADTVRAGAIEQLRAFTTLLQLPLHAVENAARLAALAADLPADTLMLIDSPGTNPYSAADRRELAGLMAAAGAEPVLVMAAGGDAIDAIEVARIFRDLGCTRLIATRLDLTHRLGSLLIAAEAAKLAFAETGVSSAIADGLIPCSPIVLARRLLAQTALPERQPMKKRGTS